MPLWRNLKGLVIINDIPDGDGDVQQLSVKTTEDETKTEKKKKEKKQKVVEVKEPPPDDDPFYARTAVASSCTAKYLYNRYYLIGYSLLLCIFIGLLLPFILTSTALKPSSKVLQQRGYCFINNSIKYPCLGKRNVSEETCEYYGCCYEVTHPDVPSCFHSQPSAYGYNVFNCSTDGLYSHIRKEIYDDGGMTTKAVRRVSYRLGTSESLTVNLDFDDEYLMDKTPYGGELWPSQLVVVRSDNDNVRLTISSPGRDEGAFLKDPNFSPNKTTDPKLDVEVTQDEGGAFNVTVYRVQNNEVLFRTIFGPFIMGDGYVEFTTTLPSSQVFGLGSRSTTSHNPLFDEFEEWSLNSRDSAFSTKSLSGTHPFYMAQESKTKYVHGVYIRTSTPLQIGTVPAPGISFRALMGAFKILILAGPTPRDVSRQYTSIVGTPSLPPYWALGFHLCRSQDNNQEQAFTKSSAGMEEVNLPYDSDCLNSRLLYPDLSAPLPDWVNDTVQEVHDQGRKVLAATYPFLVNGSVAYSEAEKADVLMRLSDEVPYFGMINGSSVGYPDYINENSFHIWMSNSSNLTQLFSQFDGAILLQNSPLNEARVLYDVVEALNLNCSAEYPQHCCRKSGFKFQLDIDVEEVSNGTICWSAVHASTNHSRHLAHHNAYGMYHSKRMHDLLKLTRLNNTRPLLVSSSTHPESGQYGGEFTEGWGLSVQEQRRALHHVLDMGLYGIPFTGPPPCGSRNDTSVSEKSRQQMCLRSYQMSLFFPFLLSHYEMGHQSTNPLDVSPGFAKQLRPFMLLRYTLLPTLYTLAEESSRLGTPIIRSLFFEFHEDEGSHNVSDQFMVGSALLVVPNFDNATDITSEVPAYLPPGCWYNLFSGQLLSCNLTSGVNVSLPTVFTDVNAFIRGGYAVFLQGNVHDEIRHSEDSRNMNFTVVAAVVNGTKVRESLYFDDGVTPPSSAGYTASSVVAVLEQADRELIIKRTQEAGPDHYCPSGLHSSVVDAVRIYGLNLVNSMTVDGRSHTHFAQDSTTMALQIRRLAFNWCDKSSISIKWTFA